MFHWSPPSKRGTLYVWRPESPDDRQNVKLKGLEPDQEYWMWCEDGSIAPGVRTGQELMQGGLCVHLATPYSSDLIFIQHASLGKPQGLEPPGVFRLQEAAVEGGWFSASATLAWEPSEHARSYRVLVAADTGFRSVLAQRVVYAPAVVLADLPPGRELFWKVEAISWGGKRSSEGDSGRLAIPELEKPAGVTFASDLTPVEATVGADNPLRRDRNYHGRPVRIASQAYPKALWTHSFDDGRPADVVFDVSGKDLASFKADVGLDDASGGGSVQFQVLVDREVKAESPVLRPRTVHQFSVDVTRAGKVTLRVLNGGDGFTCDHAAWGLARFLATQRVPGADDPLAADRGR
ncbi:MAG: hypothetical protein A2V98_06655 [Planctomycetes bacterium RBG_16_64_12]|nr:MAG: hypothetical protein A2V98_06655 [Planctomycetes bacterium RBG_16_64_12]